MHVIIKLPILTMVKMVLLGYGLVRDIYEWS